MVDKVKVLVGQRNSTELLSEEIQASSDYVSAKGISFEGLDTFLLEKLGRVVKLSTPSTSYKPTYSGDDISNIEYFSGFTQTEANRIARIDIGYTNDYVTSQTCKIYDTDGTTVLRTVTSTYSYTGDDITNVQVSEA